MCQTIQIHLLNNGTESVLLFFKNVFILGKNVFPLNKRGGEITDYHFIIFLNF